MNHPDELVRLPKVLTLWQPWAWAVINGSKRIENRSRPTAYRGRLLIHVGLGPGPQSKWEEYVNEQMDSWPAGHRPQLAELREQRGRVIGEVTLVSTAPNGERPCDVWAVPGQVGWALASPIAYARPFGLTGQQGLFGLPIDKLPELRRAGASRYRFDDFGDVVDTPGKAVAVCSAAGLKRFDELVRVNGHRIYFGDLVATAARCHGDEPFAQLVEARTRARIQAQPSPASAAHGRRGASSS